eukprot:720956-Rhodomonas_salina.2
MTERGGQGRAVWGDAQVMSLSGSMEKFQQRHREVWDGVCLTETERMEKCVCVCVMMMMMMCDA